MNASEKNIHEYFMEIEAINFHIQQAFFHVKT